MRGEARPARVGPEPAAPTGFGEAARLAVCRTVKARARHYARCPAKLDMLHPGLSTAGPASLVARAQHLAERESRSPRRWFGFGGEVGLLNARAALLLGRLERRRLGRRRPASRQEPRPEEGVCRAFFAGRAEGETA